MATTVLLKRSATGLELYFPPLRMAGSAAVLALFGAACFVPGSLAAIAVAPLAQAGPAGAVAVWLMSAFIAPFVAFGLAFPAIAAYRVANSLAVVVTEREIRTVRRLFGLAIARHRVACGNVAALRPAEVRRYQLRGDDDARFALVLEARASAGLTLIRAWQTATLDAWWNRRVTVAECLHGDDVKRVKSEILRSARLEHLDQ